MYKLSLEKDGKIVSMDIDDNVIEEMSDSVLLSDFIKKMISKLN